jgi:glycine oxidase
VAASPDVIIIGAGIVGCAVAHELARQGAQVTVFDANAPGAGASQASAGVLSPHIEAAPGSALQSLGAQSLEMYDTFVQRVCSDAGFDVPYVRDGTFEVAASDAEASHLEQTARRLFDQGVPCEFVEGSRVREIEPLAADDQRAGLLVPGHGAVRVRDLVDALRLGAVHQGARFDQPERVARVRATDGHFVVDTHAGGHPATWVVVTAGAWSIELPVADHPALPTRPVRGQLLRLHATGGSLRRVLWGTDCYLVPWGDEILAGATVEEVGFDQRATLEGVSRLCLAAQSLVPSLSTATFSEVRVGLRPGSPDGLPVIGPSQQSPRLIYAAGHYRNGVLLAPLTAALVGALVMGDDTSIPTAFLPRRFGM